MRTNAGGVIGRPSALEQVSAVLESYATRGVFQGFAPGPSGGGTARFKLLWHRGQSFDLTLDARRRILRFGVVLPDVPRNSPLYRDFKAFLTSRQEESLPPHRRIDPYKARVGCANRAGNVSLTVTVVDGDFDYGTRKLIHLVHEVYLGFLIDGPYLEYMVEAFQLDPDRI